MKKAFGPSLARIGEVHHIVTRMTGSELCYWLHFIHSTIKPVENTLAHILSEPSSQG